MSTSTQTATQVKTKTVSATKFAIAIACLGVIFVGTPVLAATKTVSPSQFKTFSSCANIKNIYDGLEKSLEKELAGLEKELKSMGEEATKEFGANLFSSSLDSAFSSVLMENSEWNMLGLSTIETSSVLKNKIDMVKTDGKYFYYLRSFVRTVDGESKSGVELLIVEVKTGEEKILSKTNLVIHEYGIPLGLYVAGKRVVIIERGIGSSLLAQIYNVSNKQVPTLERVVLWDGIWHGADVVNGNIVVVSGFLIKDIEKKSSEMLPHFVDIKGKSLKSLSSAQNIEEWLKLAKVKLSNLANCNQIKYMWPGFSTLTTTNITTIPLGEPSKPIVNKSFVLQDMDLTVRLTQEGMYVFVPHGFSFLYPYGQSYNTKGASTDIYKFNIKPGAAFTVVKSVNVPGLVKDDIVNFWNGNWRVVTIEDRMAGFGGPEAQRSANVFIMDKNLKIKTKKLGLSVAKKTMPLPVGDILFWKDADGIMKAIDLSVNPLPEPVVTAPAESGLNLSQDEKMVHIYDGKRYFSLAPVVGPSKVASTTSSGAGSDYAMGGLGGLYVPKTENFFLKFFDATDPANEVVVAEQKVGDIQSSALWSGLSDWRSLFFSQKMGLLVFPAALKSTIISTSTMMSTNIEDMHIYDVSPEYGFSLRGVVSHNTDGDSSLMDYYTANSLDVKRIVVLGDKLYAFSDSKMTVHSLSDLTLLNIVKF